MTLTAYRAAFGEIAPDDIWPGVAERFAGRFERVDRSRSWVVPKLPMAPLFAVPLLAGCVALAANSSATSFGSALGYGVLALLALLAVIVVTVRIASVGASRDVKDQKAKKDGGCGTGGAGKSSSHGDDGGGCGGCGS